MYTPYEVRRGTTDAPTVELQERNRNGNDSGKNHWGFESILLTFNIVLKSDAAPNLNFYIYLVRIGVLYLKIETSRLNTYNHKH